MSRLPARVALAALVVVLSGFACPATADEAAAAKSAGAAPQEKAPDVWALLRPLLGAWEGTVRGSPGSGTVRREYRLVLRDRFIEVRSASSYPPQEKNPKGEEHQEVGYFSRDRARKAFVLRQFHVEGFVNTYTAPVAPGSAEPIVFNTEAIENIAPGWRARETYRFVGPDELVELFELAEPGKDFTAYAETRLRRAR